MKPKKLRVPRPVHHKASGQDVVFLRQPDGRRSTVYLGQHDGAEAARRYREVLAEHLAGKVVVTSPRAASRPSQWPTVAQLVAAYLLHCERYYVDEQGRKSKGIVSITHAMAPFLHLLRDYHTDALGIVDLCSVRHYLVDGGKCCRATINGKLRRIRQCVRWGVEQRMVPGSVWHEVSAMKGLPAGRAGVRESKVVEAVPRCWVDAILPHVSTPLAAAIELQWWSGARPSEILQLTRKRLTIGNPLWEFRPPLHKGKWQGRERIIWFGPECQNILRPLLKLDGDAAILSPRDALLDIRAKKRRSRKTSPTKQTADRDARQPAVPEHVGEFYDVNTYRKAIHRACDAADVPRWSPHRLRHAAGTRLYLKAGIEGARVGLGHTDDRVTRRYAVAADSELATLVMGKHG